MERTVTEIVHDHLKRRLVNDLEGDIEANFAEDILILSEFATYRGHDGIRQSAKLLSETVHGGTFAYHRTVIEDDYGFLEWTAQNADTESFDSADSFHIQDGKIVMQSIHYTAWPR